LGRYDEALESAERGLAIDRALGHEQAIATGLGQTADILRAAGRYREAGGCCREALAAADRAGDLELQGLARQHMGILESAQGHPSAAADHYRQTLRLLQQAGDRDGEMRTCDLLAWAEADLGHLDPAEAWYRRSLALAETLAACRL